MNDELPITRQSLLVELRNRTHKAWDEFLSVYESAIVHYCRAKGLQDADARDVTQEVLAAVHRKLPDWDFSHDRGSFRGWLFRVARNQSIELIKRRQRGVQGTGDSQVAELLAEVAEVNESASDEFVNEYRRTLFRWVSEQVKGGSSRVDVAVILLDGNRATCAQRSRPTAQHSDRKRLHGKVSGGRPNPGEDRSN